MVRKYLAHISPDGREQTIADHLKGVSQYCIEFASQFGAEADAKLAAMTHDIGKYSDAFQKRLHGGKKVDHSTAGAYVCKRNGGLAAAFCVSGHHAGLPDGGGRCDTSEQSTFFGRMLRADKNLLEDYSAWTNEIALPDVPPLASNVIPEEIFFYTRMLFSCLVDADYLDTERFMSDRFRDDSAQDDMRMLLAKLQSYVSAWFPPKNELNRQRCSILERCMREGDDRPSGIFKLTVPTGGGKTVASLAFALHHAVARKKSRVIYVVPYTSIIEQTAQTFREILGDENVLEHHSNVILNEENEIEATRIRQATENWKCPVIVCTAVQFFESLFSNRPSHCRKLHNIANSVLIFDEAQMLPMPYLRPCVYAIAQLVKSYNVSAVLCTATQPTLDNLFSRYLEQTAVEICPPGSFDRSIFLRTSIEDMGCASWQDLAERISYERQALCIVNSRKSARKLFELIDDGNGCYYLTTMVYPAQRRAVLDEIRRRLKNGETCRVIATSLIEAGVDVDFPIVFREENGLDSILQAAGRCNREGMRRREDSNVYVFMSEDATPPLFATRIGAYREAMKKSSDMTDDETIANYFNFLFDLSGDDAQDKKGIMNTIKTSFFPYKTVSERFRLIENDTRTVYIPIGAGADLAERFRNGERTRELFRKLGQYGVSIYSNDYDELIFAGAIEPMEGADSAILRDLNLYDERMGLSTEVDCGAALWG